MVYKKKKSISSMVLGIVGIAFSLIVPIVTFACSIPGLLIALNHKKRAYQANAGIVLNIVGLSIATLNSLMAVVIAIKLASNERKKLAQN